ncbi:hypothetical protein C1A50_2281 [Paenibacillus polymyxa]|nr:hypothetical protein C1A50_2281 [Paenibacillus polymyxa]
MFYQKKFKFNLKSKTNSKTDNRYALLLPFKEAQIKRIKI